LYKQDSISGKECPQKERKARHLNLLIDAYVTATAQKDLATVSESGWEKLDTIKF
jgi:hypothetical protein